MKKTNYFSVSQYGYRKLRSTLDPLTLLDADIGKAFASNSYVTAIFFDIEKAYDKTWKYQILRELHCAGLRGFLPLNIKQFLRNRTFKVKVNGVLSEEFSQFEGVPQGSVLSTTLFIMAINDLAKQLPVGVQCSLYVDDFAIWIIYSDVYAGQFILQKSLNMIVSWTTAHGFTISFNKTVAITFTSKRRIPKLKLTLYDKPVNFVTHTKFLGLHFDQRMTWKFHIDYLRQSCNKVLHLLKKLSHTKWGSDRSTLLYLHKTLILSKIDYGSHLYASASANLLRRLDPLHNAGLRYATGAFRSTPVVSLYSETGLCSLDQRRVEYSLNFYSRTLRYPSKLTRVISNTIIPERIGPRSFYPYVVRLKIYIEKYNILPLNLIKHLTNSTPFWIWNKPHVCKEMFDVKKDEIPNYAMKQIFLEHQESHINTCSIYTDGSKTDAAVGFAVISDVDYCGRMPIFSSIFSAELAAISLALYKIPKVRDQEYTIYSDSKGAIQAIDNFNPQHPAVRAIQENIHFLSLKNIKVSLCWTPGHVGIEGNEIADRNARNAALDTNNKIYKTYFKDSKKYFKEILNNHWREQWMSLNNNKLREIKPTIDPFHNSIRKDRSHEVALSRLRFGHTRLTHGFLMSNATPPECDICLTRLTVKHILIECTKYSYIRQKYLGSSPRLQDILGEDDTIVQNTFDFLREINIFKHI